MFNYFNYHDIEDMISKGTTAAKLEHYIKTHNITKLDVHIIKMDGQKYDFVGDTTNQLLCYIFKKMLRDMKGCVLPYSLVVGLYSDEWYDIMYNKLDDVYYDDTLYNRGLELIIQVCNILYS